MKEGWLTESLESIWGILKTIRIVDIIDILLVSIVLYYAYKFVRDRRAGKLAAGVVLFLVALGISELMGMHTIQYIFQNILQVGVLVLVVLFQPELRSALEKMGGKSLDGIRSITEKRQDSLMLAIREVATAAGEMSSTRTGALIVFERTSRLGDIVATGTVVDAQTGSFLVRNIFFNKAPLHDGAMIIRDGRICAAGCLLPLSAQNDINRDLGTRHRAALGLSETSDAVVLVVSEETGVISLAVDGKLNRGFNVETLRATLTELLAPQQEKESSGKGRRRRKSKKNDNEDNKEVDFDEK